MLGERPTSCFTCAREGARACLFLPSVFSALCVFFFQLCGAGSGVLLAQLRCELVQVLLRFLLTVEEGFEDICLGGRQGFCPHGHGLDVFLEFCFFKSVLDGVVESRLNFCGILAFWESSKRRVQSDRHGPTLGRRPQ